MVTQLASSFNPNSPLVENSRDTLGLEFGIAFTYSFKDNDFVLENGNIKLSDETQSVIQWIANTLLVEKGIHPVYNVDYGTYVYNLAGKGFPKNAITLMVPDMIRQDLLKDPRIAEVDNFNITYKDENLFGSFRVALVNGIRFNHDMVWVI